MFGNNILDSAESEGIDLPKYDAFEHICKNEFPNNKEGLVAMIMVYCDATKHEPKGVSLEMPLYHVSGCVATIDTWKKFRQEWNKILTEHNLGYFHMTDFEYAVKTLEFERKIPKKHLFAGWTLEQLNLFYKQLCRAMNRKSKGMCRLGAFGSAVIPEFYDILRPTFLEKDVRYASYYVFNVYVIMHAIADWARERGYNEPIHYVFANGDREGKNIDNYFRYISRKQELRTKFQVQGRYTNNYDLEWMKDEPAIQSADIAAYEHSKTISDWYNNSCPTQVSKDQRRERLEPLVKNLGLHGWVYREQELKKEFDQVIGDVWKL